MISTQFTSPSDCWAAHGYTPCWPLKTRWRIGAVRAKQKVHPDSTTCNQEDAGGSRRRFVATGVKMRPRKGPSQSRLDAGSLLIRRAAGAPTLISSIASSSERCFRQMMLRRPSYSAQVPRYKPIGYKPASRRSHYRRITAFDSIFGSVVQTGSSACRAQQWIRPWSAIGSSAPWGGTC